MSTAENSVLPVTIFSFGFKYGAPSDVNLLLDVRFLPNPYWVEALRPQTGLAQVISAFVLDSPAGQALLKNLRPLCTQMIRQFSMTGRDGLRIAIGCTGGRHRSVAVVEALRVAVPEGSAVELMVLHRDIDRDSTPSP